MSNITSTTFADLNTLLTNINKLQTVTANQIMQFEGFLHSFSLPITPDPSDAKLSAAVQSSWPKSLGTPENFVSYRYYKALGNNTSAASLYIRQRYEEAARNVKGTNAVDLISIAKIINQEANYIGDFVKNYVNSTLSDSSQQRTVELLQEWSETALSCTSQLGIVFGQGITQATQLPPSEVESVSSQGAQQAQAIFTVKLNLLNSAIEKDIDSVEKQFGDFAGIFYNNFLGPALAFRSTVTSGLSNFTGTLKNEVLQSSDGLNTNLLTALTDLLRRGQNFFNQITQILGEITRRDAYVNYIEQLAGVGINMPAGTPGIMLQQTDTQAEAAFFDNLTLTPATPSFLSPHAVLDGLGADDHPQYLQKAGGDLSGSVTMDAGIKIDHMRPGTHAHTGKDGTVRIDGDDIIPATLHSGLVNTDDTPIVPYNLRVIDQTVYIVSPGVPQVQVDVGWDGDAAKILTYEVQIVPIAAAASSTIVPPPPSPPSLLEWFFTGIDEKYTEGFTNDHIAFTSQVLDRDAGNQIGLIYDGVTLWSLSSNLAIFGYNPGLALTADIDISGIVHNFTLPNTYLDILALASPGVFVLLGNDAFSNLTIFKIHWNGVAASLINSANLPTVQTDNGATTLTLEVSYDQSTAYINGANFIHLINLSTLTEIGTWPIANVNG